jgi:hypothetical protein
MTPGRKNSVEITIDRSVQRGRDAAPVSGVRRRDRGSVLVEASIGIATLLLVLIIGINLVRIGYVNVAARYSLNKTARWALLGEQLDRDVSGTMTTLSRIDSIKRKLTEYATPLGLKVTPSDITVCPIADPNCSTEDAGGPGDLFIINWDYNEHLPLWGKVFPFEFTAFARNENF